MNKTAQAEIPHGQRADVVFEGVGRRYGDVDALADFSLDIPAGSFTTLLGPSGSGKTTALNVLAGFVLPTSGRVRIGARDVTEIPPEARNLGMVFQNYSLFPHLSVGENVAFPLRMRGIDRATRRQMAGAALEKVHLSGYEARRPFELSGGQKQRVALARALAFAPPVLLMDECFSALDLKLREQLQIEIKRIHRDLGTTILFVTHDQGEALAMSDRIALLRDGRLEQLGTPHEIYDRPASRFAAGFIGKSNLLDARREGQGVSVPGLGLAFPVPAGWPATLAAISLRPEALNRAGGAPATAGAAATVRFDARVESVLFLGETVQYVLIADGGAEILWRENRRVGAAVLAAGEAVTLGFAPETIWPLPA